MKKTRSITTLMAIAAACAACTGGGGELSPAEQAKMKEGFAQKGLDESKLTPEQKAGMERWRNGGATAPSANPSSAGGSR